MQTRNPIEQSIWRYARKTKMTAKKSRRTGLWYILDGQKKMLTSRLGMSADDAFDWLQKYSWEVA